jgi:hypothetical protein
MEITRYNSDTGNRDMPAKSYNKNMPFIEILQKAVQLKAPLIVKTSYISETRPGAWYIKGHNSDLSSEDIRKMIENNVLIKKHTKRICYLITYVD